jgi:uncharacterized protein involved in type VI secretion and phage assembly
LGIIIGQALGSGRYQNFTGAVAKPVEVFRGRLKTLLRKPALLQLLTATSRDDLRPFHGHFTKVAMDGANGGFARYTLSVEPWTAFLAHTTTAHSSRMPRRRSISPNPAPS